MANLDENVILALALKALKGGGGGGGGTTNYNELDNRPMINGKVLEGNMTTDDLNAVSQDDYLTENQINDLIALL